MEPLTPAPSGDPPIDLHPDARWVVDLYAKMRSQWDEIGRPHPTPHPCFRDLPPSTRLQYETLSWTNYQVLLDLFQYDESPFVMSPFKSRPKLDEYVAYQLVTGRYSGKRGSIDWFIRLHDGTKVGVLHLYDVNFELWDGKRFPCMCGYAIAQPYRRLGYAEEALHHLLSLLPTDYKLFEVQAEPLRTNDASRALLEKTGFSFQKNSKNEWGLSALYYKKLVAEIPTLSFEELDELY